MSYSNISKFAAFVIAFAAVASGCTSKARGSHPAVENAVYAEPRVVGRIANPDIIEASGLAASKCQPGVFWTHNDSGDGPYIYALNERGDNLGTWRVSGARNIDWEDIATFKDAAGKCYVYTGDIGDNKLQRETHTIYRVPEPAVTAASAGTTGTTAAQTEPAEALEYTYPDGGQNAETMLVHPVTGDIYVLSKSRDKPSGVYRLPAGFGGSGVRAAKVAELKVPAIPFGLLTGGDVAPDGRSVVVCDYAGGYELRLPEGDKIFDDIWSQKPVEIDLGKRDTGEAVAYSADGTSILATTENQKAPIIKLQRK